MFEVNEMGVVQADAEDLKQELIDNVYVPAFGGGLNTDATSPMGALINADTALITKVQSSLSELANCYNPFSAVRSNLTKIGNSYGYIRRQESPAHASVIFSGLTGLTVPAGFKLKDQDGNLWTTDNDVVIGSYVGATCSKVGTHCPPNFITTLVDVLTGIDSVSQPTVGVSGYEQESDAEMSKRMIMTGYAGRGRGTLGAIASAISNVNGVYGISFHENPTDEPTTWRGISMARNSIYFCVAGGKDEDIARAIAITKTNGCSMNGSVQVNFNDPENTSYQYTYLIDRPSFQNIYVRLISKSGTDLSNVIDLFKNALDESQSLNAFAVGGEITAVNIIDRIPQNLTDLGIIGCDVSFDGEAWSKSVQSNANVILQIPRANVSIVQEESE